MSRHGTRRLLIHTLIGLLVDIVSTLHKKHLDQHKHERARDPELIHLDVDSDNDGAAA